MKEIKNANQGFTLLELLVVVVIIGILTAIALPQYQKAVIKSKSAQMYEAISILARAAQTFYMVQGTWPNSFEQLDINYDLNDEESSVCGSTADIGGIKRNNDFEFLIANRDLFSQASVRLVSGPYKCAGFSIFFGYSDFSDLENKLLCYESSNSSVRGSKNQKGDFCEKVMGYTFLGIAPSSYFFMK